MSQEPTPLEIVGTITHKMEAVSFASGFTKREFVVTTEERYPQPIKLEVVKDKCALLDKFSEGERVSVSFNLRGNEHNGRFFVNLVAWRIASFRSEAAAPAPKQAEACTPPADTDENYPF
jgi:hypothetical protein